MDKIPGSQQSYIIYILYNIHICYRHFGETEIACKCWCLNALHVVEKECTVNTINPKTAIPYELVWVVMGEGI